MKASTAQTTATALIASLTLLILPACRSDKRPGADFNQSLPRATPIVIFGVDGVEWDVVLPLLQQGRMPQLAALMERGYYGELKSFRPTYSPVLWTSVATGKVLQKHGIYHFAYRGADRRLALFDSTDRRTKAIWNILSDYGRSICTIGWWMTYPVEEINGVMVAQTNTEAQFDTRQGKQIWKGTLLKGVAGQVHPLDRQSEMIAVLEEVERELPYLTRQVFGELPHSLSVLGRRLWDNCRWSFRADATYVRIALKLARENARPDLMLVYLGGTDVVGHRFWRYLQPEVFHDKPTPRQIENFGTAIQDYYAYADRALGQVLAEYPADTTVFVISDHGMRAYNRLALFNPEDPPDDVNSGHHKNAPPGIFVAAGPYIRASSLEMPLESLRREDLETVGSVLDITPTILAMMRLPVGKDMDGRPMTRIFRDEFQIDRQPPAVTTHDTPEFLAGRGKRVRRHPGEQERLDQLRSLGYIGDDDY